MSIRSMRLRTTDACFFDAAEDNLIEILYHSNKKTVLVIEGHPIYNVDK